MVPFGLRPCPVSSKPAGSHPIALGLIILICNWSWNTMLTQRTPTRSTHTWEELPGVERSQKQTAGVNRALTDVGR